MRQQVEGKVFDEERALYHLCGADVRDCTFAGERDGESVLKEARDVTVRDCRFSLRYPLWHARKFSLERSCMDGNTRAPIWYAEDGRLENCTIDGIKCLRECDGVWVGGSTIHSPEFGWKCRGVTVEDSAIESEYLFFESRGLEIRHLKMKGKYSFQYVQNAHIRNSVLDTKDAFWHSENITVEDSVVKGEYLGWFSSGLTLINCKIIGTQPLCYCKGLRLVNCTMEGADFAFEYSDVDADIRGHVISVKNPKSGIITADSVGAVIQEDAVMETFGRVVLRERKSAC